MRDTIGIILATMAPVQAPHRDTVALVTAPPLAVVAMAARVTTPTRLSTCYESRYGQCWSED